ncbi:uncharacterized protein DUF4154 [Pseudoduganella lurida]|uniref:Uncharacterized protein DUF4154 n=1 Tax=Pseudoduganella lurida TaxID=1036180 RepID=A0A562RLV4_9BURK|nr:YfiR family protein [Pseudoduganella lurida]TWI69989.1 uncharacterized protein DUF4154 [Pseudoduganella lurida]
MAPFSNQRRVVRALLAATLGVALLSPLPASLAAQGAIGSTSPNLERSVKAAYLFKFLGYVEFAVPADAAAPLAVGVLGADDVAAELTRITAGKTVGGRPVTVRAVREGDPLAGLHMVFVGANTEGVAKALRAAMQSGVLGVAEDDAGLQYGAVINFRLVDERVRFEVSMPAAERSNLKLSSRLLSVAWHVQKGN